jgi:hypothetical protein
MAKIDLPDLFTRKELESARTKGELVGMAKGAVLGVAGMLVLKVIGWIPAVAVIGIGGFVLYKLFSRPSSSS